jgi:sphingomyelin phosphodiesterase acid-like 3
MTETSLLRSAMVRRVCVAGLLMLVCAAAGAQPPVTVVMLSDLHFDPFHDPAKAVRLARVPLDQWQAILDEPNSGGQAGTFAAMQKECRARGEDTDEPLLNASLAASHAQVKRSAFVTVSGDLLAHQFECRYDVAMKGAVQQGYAAAHEEYVAFAAKAMNYVVYRVENEFAAEPVYFALGNNDSDCGDYKLDEKDPLLAATDEAVMAGLRRGIGAQAAAERVQAGKDYADGGYYSVQLGRPMQRTRLMVINDIYMSRNYATCAGKKDDANAAAQLEWVQKQLDAARKQHEAVWVMGHIPPGVDAYSTFSKMKSVCAGSPIVEFTNSQQIAEVLAKNADVVRLAIFAHTHMDEVKLVASADSGVPGKVAMKLVPSISPVDGNKPSFTVGLVNPATAVLRDYAVYVGTNGSGLGTQWNREYSFDSAYHATAFDPGGVNAMLVELRSKDKNDEPAIRQYEHDFFPGTGMSLLSLVWPQYVCTLDHFTTESFKACACSDRR